MTDTDVAASTNVAAVEIVRAQGRIWSHVRHKWLDETPEETVRQEYFLMLANEYGFNVEQMSEEVEVTGRGSGQARADFVVWRSVQDKVNRRSPLIVVECKSDKVTITPEDYWQGDRYARYTNARFLVTHNSRETKYWRVLHDRMPKSLEEISNIPHAEASDREVERLLSELKTFREDEFAALLHRCHNVIRNRDKLDPAAAFDEIAKILFVKVFVERDMRRKRQKQNKFTSRTISRPATGDQPTQLPVLRDEEEFEERPAVCQRREIKLKPATARLSSRSWSGTTSPTRART